MSAETPASTPSEMPTKNAAEIDAVDEKPGYRVVADFG
jgi:hypothetical protein